MKQLFVRATSFAVALLAAAGSQLSSAEPSAAALNEALTFHASFDGGIKAAFGQGDLDLYHAPNLKKRAEAKPGLPEAGMVKLIPGEGKFRDALRFASKPPLLFYRAENNMHYAARDWSGTVSLWLRVDPETELAPGYTDPVQITPRAWNDAAFFVEFGIETPRPFRLGVYPDFKVWNPENRDFKEIPSEEKPLFGIEHPPFSADRWTHVVFTWENFNTGKPDGVAKLYLDGKYQGEISAREQTFTWVPADTLIIIGLDYIGMLDELALFNRALDSREVDILHRLPEGIRSLRQKK
jgi:hypothetical protein